MLRKANSRILNRAAVVQAALTLIDKMGLEQVTMADLAEHLQIRTPSLYNHVNGIVGLRRELALFGMHELATRMGQVVMGKAGDEAIIALADAYRAFVKEHPGLYTATLRAPAPDDTELQKVEQEAIDILLKVLSAYNLQAENAIHAIRILRSTIHGFTTLEIAGGFVSFEAIIGSPAFSLIRGRATYADMKGRTAGRRSKSKRGQHSYPSPSAERSIESGTGTHF